MVGVQMRIMIEAKIVCWIILVTILFSPWGWSSETGPLPVGLLTIAVLKLSEHLLA